MAHTHDNHEHTHGEGCGHTRIQHGDHIDYLHDGHLHHQTKDGTVEEHIISVSATHPDQCTPTHLCEGHDAGHVHGPGCGHEAVPHGDHIEPHDPYRAASTAATELNNTYHFPCRSDALP